MVASDLARYRDAWRDPQPMRIGMTVGMLCLDDGARARRLAGPAFRWFYGELLKVVAPVLERLVPGYEGMREIGRYRRLARFGAHPRLLELAGLTVVGTPAECLAKIVRYREAGVTHLLCAVGAGVLPTEVVRESLTCIARTVIPALASS
jgi:alkanesulfonate monooxygenase SsuD/methylene tetrahydromethanopterin reductase-like flavin-dependent oxidoreductase (luciferase family)